MRAGPSQEEIRRFNLGALLRYVHVRGPTSRAELTANLGLNRSTIGALTADLVAAGLVREELPRDHGRAGRPSLVVRPEPEVYVFAFTIDADRVTAARVGLGGVVLDHREVAGPRHHLDCTAPQVGAEVLHARGGKDPIAFAPEDQDWLVDGVQHLSDARHVRAHLGDELLDRW